MVDERQRHIENVEFAIPDEIVASYNHVYDNVFSSENVGGICFGCACGDKCDDTDTCICLAQYGQNYSSEKKLLLIDNMIHDSLNTKPIFECNSCCTCNETCNNRVVQSGLNFKLKVYRTQNKQYGVQTLQDIPKGSYVIDYAGEVLDVNEARRRVALKGTMENNYLLSVKEKYGTKFIRTDIDAAQFGNVSRFINHSCDPNLLLHPVRVETVIPRLALFAKIDIASGAELSFDYSGGEPSEIVDPNKVRLECRCLSKNCKGLLPTHQAFDSD